MGTSVAVGMARTLEPFPLPFRMRHWKKNSVGFKLGHKVVCLALCGVGDTLIYIGKTQKRKTGRIGSEDLVAAFFPLRGFLATQNLT